jgi:hypothetical protein
MVTLDLRDNDGAMLARSCFQDERRVRDFIDDCKQEELIPTAIVALSREAAEERMARRFPDLWRKLSRNLPPGSFHVAVFAFGGQGSWTHPSPKGVAW